MHFRRLRRALLAILCGWPLLGDAGVFAGDPSYVRLRPNVDVFPQNFALAQAPDGVLYVGNHDGVLVYDGERWQLLPLPNGDIVRALAAGDDGRIYVGGYDQFGYLQRDVTGTERFHDLTSAFASLLDGEQFADIWQIQLAPEGVFFRGVQHLFLYEPATGETRLWRRPERFGALVHHGGELLLQFRDEGLRRYAGGEWQTVAGTGSLKALAHLAVPLPDGGLLLLSTDGEWRVYRDGELRAFPAPAGFPPPTQFTRGVVTHDAQLALATNDGALVILEPQTGKVRRFDLATGFISALGHALDGGILMLSNDEIVHVDWPPRWTLLGKEHGLAGTVHAFARWNSRWHVLTGSGVHELLPPETSADARFARREWTDHSAWDLLPLNDREALLATSYALLHLEDDEARAVSGADLYPRVLQRSAFDPDVVYVGTETGIAVARRHQGRWQMAANVNDLDAPGVRSIVQASPREVWLGTLRGGVMQIVLSPGHEGTESVRRFDERDGIEYGGRLTTDVVRPKDGRLIASTRRGFFAWNGERFLSDALGGLAGLRGEDERLMLAVAPDGTRWAYSYNHVFRHMPDSGWREEDVGIQRRGAIETIAFDDDGAAILGATNSILRHDAKTDDHDSRRHPVLLRGVAFMRTDGTLDPLPLHAHEPLDMDAGNVNLMFQFALPDYSGGEGPRYSARLAGLEEHWSAWATTNGFTYFNVQPGEYRFELRARDRDGRITSIEPWRFNVVANWYARPLALAVWGVLAFLLLALTVNGASLRRTRRLALETSRLEGMIADRTRELEEANRKLDAIAHLDGLTGIPNRRRLDEYLAHMWSHCAMRERPLSLLVIDVDHFKQYNDEHGHVAGDRLLRKIANLLAHNLRRTEDLVARYGGEEFLVVLPGAELATACELAGNLRELVESSSLGATISIGVASVTPGGETQTATHLINMADSALYEAKAAGRNCVRVDAAVSGKSDA